jgi:hypothetical protein
VNGLLGDIARRNCDQEKQISDVSTAMSSARALERRLRAYTRPHVLAIDQIGYLACDTHAADIKGDRTPASVRAFPTCRSTGWRDRTAMRSLMATES